MIYYRDRYTMFVREKTKPISNLLLPKETKFPSFYHLRHKVFFQHPASSVNLTYCIDYTEVLTFEDCVDGRESWECGGPEGGRACFVGGIGVYYIPLMNSY
jgi:hypothetical protein